MPRLYRYFHSWGSVWNPDHQEIGKVNLEVFEVVRETERCWYIMAGGKEKRVLKGDGKRFAHEKKEWAAYSFRRRMKSERAHYVRAIQKLDDVANTLILSWPGGKDEPGVYTYDFRVSKELFNNMIELDHCDEFSADEIGDYF